MFSAEGKSSKPSGLHRFASTRSRSRFTACLSSHINRQNSMLTLPSRTLLYH